MNFERYQTQLSLKTVINSSAVIWFVILLGLTFRLVPYIENRSLWLDESMLALNIVNRSYSELLLPLDMHQGAPPGFLLTEKFLTQIIGENEYALRLFPLISGLLSVFIFYLIARQTLDKEVLLLGLFLFSISTTSVYFASETKQYASDVLISMSLILLTIRQISRTPGIKYLFIYAGAGIVAIIFSHPSVFILAGCGTTMIVSSILIKNNKRLFSYLSVSAIWLAFFVLVYMFHTRFLHQNNGLMNYWNNAFMPFPPKSIEDLKWFFLTSQQVFKSPMGYTIGGLASFFFILGGIYQWQKSREIFFIFILPMLFALIASGLHKFPFAGRLILFLQPVFIIFIISGIYLIASSAKRNKFILYLIPILFIVGPMTLKTIAYVAKPERNEIKNILYEIKMEYQPGDIIIVEGAAAPQYRFYYEKFDLPPADIVYDARNIKKAKNNDKVLQLAETNRAWYIFIYFKEGKKPETFIPNYLDNKGIRIRTFKSTGAAGYLYEPSKKKKQ